MMKVFLPALLLLCTALSAQSIGYTTHAKPIFNKYGCTDCHGGSGNFFLDAYATVFTTGNHKPVVVAGDTNSVLIKKIKGIAGFGDQMPKGGPVMDPADLRVLINWVLQGAVENPTTEVRTGNAEVIPTFALQQNYPNPFNPSTTIEYSVAVPGNVRLTVYNELGKECAVLFDRTMEAGSYRYMFDASALPSGVYYYRIQSAGSSHVKKLMLVK
ncbi:MAG: T9SS type A sorting domain-containing protein [Bacteroidota bacterium]